MNSSLTSTAYHAGSHCSEEQLLEPSQRCPFCSFIGERERVLTIQDSPTIFLLECPNCSAISASRMPTEETLAHYYAHYRQDTQLKVTFFSPKRFSRHLLNIIGDRWRQSCVRILDFGGGDGALSIALAELLCAADSEKRLNRSSRIDLIDYSQQSQSPLNPSVSIQQFDSLDQVQRNVYDLVIASSVIEHLPEPMPIIRDLFRAMKVGGVLYARTPWIVPVFRILAALGVGFDFTFPAHVHDLGKRFWEQMPKRLTNDQSEIRLLHSHPSPVETNVTEAPLRTLAAYFLKAPWQLMPNKYPLVGGWEVVFERTR